MSTNADATGMQGIDELTIIPSDFLNNLGAATSSAIATSALSSHDWGVHSHTINFSGGSDLSIKQVMLWGGVALLGWYLIKKIRGK